MKIGELSEVTGVSVRSLRYYEEQELLVADRTAGGQRVYGGDAPERVRLIQCLYSASLTSRSIALLLTCESTKQVGVDMVEHVRRQQRRTEHKLAQLTEAHSRLGSLLETLESARMSARASDRLPQRPE